jgi:anti-sigma-K factor RskA
MSETVNGADTPDIIAGEYVLGTLDGDERSHAQSLLAADPEFAAKVKVWERRLGELHLMVEPVEPEAAIWERIKIRVPEIQQQPQVPEPQPAEPDPAELQPPESESAEPQHHAEPQSVGPPHAAPATDEASARLDAAIAAISEAASAPPAEALANDVAAEPAVAPSSVVAEPPLAAAVTPAPAAGREQRLMRRLNGWRAFAVLMTVLVVAVAALVAAWRFAPDRVPPTLQPVALLRLVGVNVAPPPAPAVRRPLPPQSQFDE